ncbi:hypothetical protein CCR81_04565 [Halorhodospira halophila]|nr:hypothetical protein [Halorhodospira halophila]
MGNDHIETTLQRGQIFHLLVLPTRRHLLIGALLFSQCAKALEKRACVIFGEEVQVERFSCFLAITTVESVVGQFSIDSGGVWGV